MAVLIKCYTDNMSGNTVDFQPHRHRDSRDPEEGDQIFLWKIELENPRFGNPHSSGVGLAERGVLAQKSSERQTVAQTPKN
jgi:hypothetical protein